MNAKTTIGLMVCLLAAVGGLYYLRSGNDADQPKDPVSRKLVDLTFGDVKGYEIKHGSDAARAFTRAGDSEWNMTAPIATAAQGSQVESDVRKILDLEYDKAYGPQDDPPGNDLTSLDTPVAVVKVTDKDDKTHVLKIGARQQLSEKTYVQKVGSETVYLVPGDLNSQFDNKLHEYRSKRLLSFRSADVDRLEVSGETNYIAVKAGNGWNIEAPFQARADLPTLNRAASALSNLFVVDFVEDNPSTLRPYGLDPPRLTAKIIWHETPVPRADDENDSPPSQLTKEATIAFGAKAENNVFAYLVRDDTSPITVFQVSESTFKNLSPNANDLRDKRIADFTQPLVSQINYQADGDAIVLAKNGSDWVIDGSGDPPVFAERSAVDDFLRVLKNLKAEGFETQPSPTHGLDNPRAKVRLNLGSQGTTEILVGAETPSKTGVYIQNVADDTVAVVPVAEAAKILVDPISFNARSIFEFDTNAVLSFDLRRGSTQFAIVKTEGDWHLTTPVEGLGQTDHITEMLTALSGLKAMRVVGRSDEFEAFGLDAPQYSMAVSVAASPPATEMTVAFTAVREGGSRYLMKDGGEFIYEVEERLLAELDKEFLSTRIFEFNADDVRKITFSGENNVTFEHSGNDDGAWSLTGEPTFDVATPKLTTTIDALANLSCVRYVSYNDAALEALGLDQPWRDVTLSLADGREMTLQIADRGPNAADRYARVVERPDRAFVLLGTVVSQFNKSAADFKQ